MKVKHNYISNVPLQMKSAMKILPAKQSNDTLNTYFDDFTFNDFNEYSE